MHHSADHAAPVKGRFSFFLILVVIPSSSAAVGCAIETFDSYTFVRRLRFRVSANAGFSKLIIRVFFASRPLSSMVLTVCLASVVFPERLMPEITTILLDFDFMCLRAVLQ